MTDDWDSERGVSLGGGRGGRGSSLFSKRLEFSGAPRVPKWRPSSGSSPTRPFHLLLIALAVLLLSPLCSLLFSLLPSIASRLRLPLQVLPTPFLWAIL